MDNDYLDQLFSKFSQAEKSTSRRFGGTGLGMSITKEIINLMGGSIEVKSKKGQGTEFQISITLTKGDTEHLSDNTQENQFLPPGPHILLVEDSAINRFIVNKSLSHFGCTTDEAENGLIALELLKEKSYDLILMDIQMPELDGVETTKIIRNELKLDLPIIAVTANAFKKDIDLYLSIGMNGYVTKPFEEKDLFTTIAKLLHRSSSTSTNTSAPFNGSYDLSKLRALSRGDENFVNELVDIFLQQTPKNLKEISDALLEKDYRIVARVAHRIKPSIDSMGITQIADIPKSIELATKAKEVDHVELTRKVIFLSNTLTAVLEKLKTDIY
jgi:CheY-like chemotaxis protein/HPt (histidine-containing phosphotransfer) domain-containing protein